MDARPESSRLNLKSPQTESPWIPTTPVKPGLTGLQSICTKKHRFESIQSNWVNPEQIYQQTQACKGNCLESDISSCYWDAAVAEKSQVHGDSLSIYNKFSMEDAYKWNKVSFTNLLALADAAGPAVAASIYTASSAESKASTPVSSSQIEYSPCQTMSRFSSLENEGFLFESRLQNGSDTVDRGTAFSPKHFFDLNSAPRTVVNASSSGVFSQFEPITPDQTTKRESTKKANTLELNEHQNEGQSELIENQSCASMSMPSENHKPGVGKYLDTDLKTPPQKPRRRKHRPKVVVEGGPKRSPNPRTTKPTGSTGIARVKRKYVRKNGASEPGYTPLEGKTGITIETDPTGSEQKLKVKRKYVRRKEVSEPQTIPLKEGTSGTTELKATRAVRKSCRRSLNFDSESEVVGEKSKYQSSSNLGAKSHTQISNEDDQSRSTMNCRKGMAEMVEKMEAGTAYDCTQSMNHALEDSLYTKELQAPCPTISSKIDQLHNKLMTGHPDESTRGECRIIFSDTTHDKEANIVEMVNTEDPSGISNCSTTTFLALERTKGLKRLRVSTTDESYSCSINAAGVQCSSLQVYLKICPLNGHYEDGIPNMHFPAIPKKKRTQKVSKPATSSMVPNIARDYCVRTGAYSPNDPSGQAFMSGSSFGLPATLCDPSCPTKIATTEGAQNERQDIRCLLCLDSTDRLTKKRSKGLTRVRDFTSLLEICGQLPRSSTQRLVPSAPGTCMEALVADTRERLTTRKRSKRNIVRSSPDISNLHQVFMKSMGPPAAIMWKNISPIDAVVEGCNRLDIDAESIKFDNKQHNALAAYQQEYPGQTALVVYQSDGTMIPYDGSLDHKRKRLQPKVDLDDETTRVWKLLLEDINNEGIDGTDEQKAEWWKAEREVFWGRANSFIARMRLLQGDRRFTRWKGSVVDSVVGVFLTQNVSDHLSSSAFISLTARFPCKSSNHEPSREEGTSEEPDVLDPDDTIEWQKKASNQQNSEQDSFTLQYTKYKEEGLIYCRDLFGITSEGIKLTENSKFLLDSSEYGSNLYGEAEVDRLDAGNNRTLASLDGVPRELDDAFCSQNSAVSPQSSLGSISQATNETESCPPSSSKADPVDGDCCFASFVQMAGTTAVHGVCKHGSTKRSSSKERPTKSENSECNSQRDQDPGNFDPLLDRRHTDNFKETELSATEQSGLSEDSAAAAAAAVASLENNIALSFEKVLIFSGENRTLLDNYQMPANNLEIELDSKFQKQRNSQSFRKVSSIPMFAEPILDASGETNFRNKTSSPEGEAGESQLDTCNKHVETDHGMNPSSSKTKRERNRKEKKNAVDWDRLRKEALANGKRWERTANTMDSVDWEAVRCAPVEEVAKTIKERGMNNRLAERIQDFLNRLVRDHGSIDLEWLRDVPPDRAKEYLLSIRGLGLKSVECVRLLTLHHHAFPVDTNVGRILVRLGWVPLQPLPESLQIHLLEQYPVLESIQEYIWPRFCKFDRGTLYELHYQLITFGKVFCTKSNPNCNSCPMRAECKHFASAFASARLALPAPEEKSILSATESKADVRRPGENILQLPQPLGDQPLEAWPQVNNTELIIGMPETPEPIIEGPPILEPIIEMPATPEPEIDIEESFPEDEGIPTMDLNIEKLNQNLQNFIQNDVEMHESSMSKALVVLTPEAASIPMPKLKKITRLRTEHRVYELPDTHRLLQGFDKREPDDPCPYLLAIWTPGETVNSLQPPERRCSMQESGELCYEETCFSCNSVREARSQTVRGTLLIPCRSAMRGSFPLNGTYFQVNEVFADHESSLNPIDVPRDWLWTLQRRTVYFGTSIHTIFKGLGPTEIQYCFWRGFVCVRGFDRKALAPRPLIARLHLPASKKKKTRGRMDDS